MPWLTASTVLCPCASQGEDVTGVMVMSKRLFLGVPTVALLCLSLLLATPARTGTGIEPDLLTPEERAWIADHPVLRIAPDPGYEPIEFFSEKGVYSGIAADYLSLIRKRTGLRFQIVRLRNREEIFTALRTRKVDVLGAATKTPQRSHYLLFTRPYLQIPLVMIARSTPHVRLTPDHLAGKKVSVVTGHVAGDYVALGFPRIVPDQVPDVPTGLRNVSFGESDVLLENLLIATVHMEKEGIANLHVSGELGYYYMPAIACRSDWPILNRILEKGLAGISAAEREVIYKKWVPFESQVMLLSKSSRTRVLAVLGVLALIIATIIAWNRSLNRQVGRKTAELKRELAERRRVEEELLRARNELESRVEERTAELARTLDALRESEERYRRIIDTANEGIWVVDGDFRFTFVNGRMAEMLGYTLEEMLGKNFLSFVCDEDRAAQEREEQARRAGRTSRYERRFRRKDGETVWALVSVTPIMDSEENFQGSLAMCVDITRQKQAVEALCLTQFAVDRVNIQAQWMDSGGRLFYVNDAACASLGYSREELLSLSIPDIDPLCTPESFSDQWRELRERGSVLMETFHRAKGGRVYPVEVRSNYLVYEGKEYNCSFVTDISDRRQAEEALREAHDLLEDRVRERTAQLAELTEELSRAEERERRRIATELHDQVGQMLALSKIHLESLDPCLPADTSARLLDDVLDYICKSIEEIRSLTFQLSPPLLYEVGLGAALEGLCEELEDKYLIRTTFRDGTTQDRLTEDLRIALYRMARELMINVVKHAEASRMFVEVKGDPGTIEIVIEDDGIGFDVQKSPCRGTPDRSFGLFNVQQRVSHLGGTLHIRSEMGRGSRITLSVPLVDDTAPSSGRSQ